MRLVSDSSFGILTVFMEAEGESVDGKTAVAEVILRRTMRKFQSDGTIAGTVLRPYQFSCWNTKSPSRVRAAAMDTDSEIGRECVLAWDRAVAGSNLTQDALLYLNPHGMLVLPAWAMESRKVASIGKHHFYVDRLPPEMVRA